MFPAFPVEDSIDKRGLFLCQDPELRSKILPLFTFDPLHAAERPIGLGTTFRVDPWATCATAYHVLEDMLKIGPSGNEVIFQDTVRPVALELSGIAFGRPTLPPDAWRPIYGLQSVFGKRQRPLQPKEIKNFCELISLGIQPSVSTSRGTPFLPVDLVSWKPAKGSQVLALGFADLDVGHHDDRPISQYLYGSIAKITDIEQPSAERERSWPMFRVDADWPSGMSGGPVFNDTGHVIGVVSTGIGDASTASAAHFSSWNIPGKVFPTLDALNPGWFNCYAIFNEDRLVFSNPNKTATEAAALSKGLSDIRRISLDPTSGEYLQVQ